jgi:hypothetical protein
VLEARPDAPTAGHCEEPHLLGGHPKPTINRHLKTDN